jgi:hypothetical protein
MATDRQRVDRDEACSDAVELRVPELDWFGVKQSRGRQQEKGSERNGLHGGSPRMRSDRPILRRRYSFRIVTHCA